MGKPRVTNRVLREVKTMGVGGNTPVLQAVQKYEGAKPVGGVEYRFVSYFNNVMRPNRGQGVTGRLDVVKTLVKKMEALETALEDLKPGRPFEHGKEEEIVDDLFDLEEDNNITDEDF